MNAVRRVLAGRTDPERKYRVLHRVFVYTLLVCLGLGIGIVSLMLASTYLQETGEDMFRSYFEAPLVLTLNLAPPVLLMLALYFAFGRGWAAFAGTSVLVLLPSLINFYKIRLRSDPFVAADIALAKEAGAILAKYTIIVSGRVWLTLGAVAVGLVAAALLLRRARPSWQARIAGFLACVLAGAALYAGVYTNETVYQKADNSKNINVFSELQVFVSKGFVLPFLHSVPDAFPQAPEGYSRGAAAADLAVYADADIPEGKKVNVIAIMLEAYADLSVYPQIGVHGDVYAPLRRIQAEAVSGGLISNVFAGGTINTERSFLTGYTQDWAYRRDVDSFVRYFRSQGYYTEGFHAGDGWFYNRQNVNRWLGFDRYLYLEDFEDANRSDRYFFAKVEELFEARDPDVPYFQYSLSYQNHGAYPDDSTGETAYLDRGDLSEASYNILNNYLAGIADTTMRLEMLTDYFTETSAPVVLVFFGDHMPWLGNGGSVYAELGISLDTGTEEGFYNHCTVPYVIWANAAAKAALGDDFAGDGGEISPCFLMEAVFDRAGWTGSAWMQAVRDLRRTFDIVHTNGAVRIGGQLTTAPDAAAAETLRRFLCMEFYAVRTY